MDRKLTMSDLTQLELPAGLAHSKVEVMVQWVRLAKACLRAVAGETELFLDAGRQAGTKVFYKVVPLLSKATRQSKA